MILEKLFFGNLYGIEAKMASYLDEQQKKKTCESLVYSRSTFPPASFLNRCAIR